MERASVQLDPALRSAWRRLVRLWRPMAGWTLLVWLLVAVVLAPLTSLLLGWPWLTGREPMVANEALLAWGLSPRGLVWIVLAGSLGLAGTVVHFAGIHELVTEQLEGTPASVPETALRLAPELPALARLSGAAVLAGLLLAVPMVAGLAGIHQALLGAHDINYYLAERPRAWWLAVGSAAAWLLAWGALVLWLAGRSLLAVPAFLDGHRPLRAALRRSWRTTRGEGVRTVRVVMAAAAAWLVLRAALDAAAVAGGTMLVGWAGAASDSLYPVVAATGGWALLSVALDAAVGFLGLAYVFTVVTTLYHEDTALHAGAPGPAGAALPARAQALVGRWLRPARLLPALGLVAAASLAAGGLLLERLPEPRPVEVIAHRAGPPPSPENTLAALERSVEAGAEWAEIDVQLTGDGVPVVVHDADLLRVAGDPRRVGRTDHDELRGLVQRPDDGTPPAERRVATLEEFLERARGRIGLVVELKYYGFDPGLAEAVVRTLRRAGPKARVMALSLELRGIHQLRELAPELRVGYAAAAAVGDPSRLPVDVLALSRSAATPSLVRDAHRRGLEVHVWTVNRARAMAEAIQMGADGLVTDRPARAVRVRDELAGLPAVSRLLLRFGHLLVEVGEEEGPNAEL